MKQEAFQYLRQQNPEINIPDEKKQITDPALQRNAFWQDEIINRLRSELFIAATALYQAWLYEALSSKKFQQSVFKVTDLLRGKHTVSASDAFNILFMMIPVVSTTFTSLGIMFRSVKSDALDWLLIDEAAQSVPQAAVGGLWRSQRVLIVGDPLQIEPVFTIPPKLVQHLSDTVLGSDSDDWNPGLWSVQKIADRANRYRCELPVMDEQVWVGVPLWVHRRCIEPMFSLANQIAYDNRMIHAGETDDIAPQPPPCFMA